MKYFAILLLSITIMLYFNGVILINELLYMVVGIISTMIFVIVYAMINFNNIKIKENENI